MRILITGSHTRLGVALVAALSSDHEVRTLDAEGTEGPWAYVGDPRNRDVATRAVEGCDAVVHQLDTAEQGSSPQKVIDEATRGTFNLALTARPECRFVLISSLRTFERYPVNYRVNEWWAPKPTTAVEDLASYLAEVTTQVVARDSTLRAIVLRVGEIVDDDCIRGRPADARWLHVEDAVQAVQRALVFDIMTTGPAVARSAWVVYHIVGAGRRTRFPLGLAGQQPFGYTTRHDLTAGVSLPIPQIPAPDVKKLGDKTGAAVHKVVIFGAGSALGAATTTALKHDHILRLANRRPFEEVIAENRPMSLGSPLPELQGPPHEMRLVDIADPGQVLDAVRGMDAIVNSTVVRGDPVQSFRVNVLGAYNVVVAAVECGVRRIVHTGPQQVTHRYMDDFDITADVPGHVSLGLYDVTKLLSNEICRIFAEEHELEIATHLYCIFVKEWAPPVGGTGVFPLSVEWDDSADAIKRSLHVPSFPHPYEVFYIAGDLPHGKYPNVKAKELLGWQPRYRYEHMWQRKFE